MDLNKLLKTQWDRAGAIGLTALGAIFLLVGWIGVSGTALLAEQAPYILSGGVGGVFLLGIGSTLWISADLRDEWRKLDRIEQAIGEGVLRWEEGPETAVAPAFAARTAPAREVLDSTVEVPAVTVAKPKTATASSNGTAKAARTASTPRRTKASTAAAHDA